MEAQNAAQQGIEQVISKDFTANPAAAAASVPVDVNGDGSADYTAQVAAPVCQTSKPVKNTDLDTVQMPTTFRFVGNGNQDTGILTASGGGGAKFTVQRHSMDDKGQRQR
ncbi:hypothetical protein ACU4GD_16950 [Cupriavidus basilensis]